MRALALAVQAIGGLNRLVGNVFSWLAVGVVAICFVVVVQRYLFHTTFLWMQDLYVWLSGAMFTAVAGFALLRDDHVRVDILYRPASTRTKAICDIVGVLIFLFPFMFVVWTWGLPYVQRSWSFYEASQNIGGMPGLFVLKTFILVFAVLIALQGVSMIARAILVLADKEDLLPPAYRYPVEAEEEMPSV
ncbi:TRAP transporter small permease subunit [Pelagibacterium sp. H642]|uniref:TRAP transporter small permease subunit n=1 Tax=Pelagibacterium sp. H642 TaxID=1881069 RepID=UPI002814EEAE|nr:TRAP transporter small permease subunit [Pelagibacterium sp. H642]WMT91062.1 TRAP transporter small permease subunit [Pelagibacterium sp. H642]